MRTFLAFLHMGRVECVTDQVAWSHSRGGDLKSVEEGSLGLYFLGERSKIGGLDELDGSSRGATKGASTIMVVPPGDSPGGRLESGVGSAIL